MPKISLNPLSLSSIENALAEVQKYADTLEEKCNTVRKRIADELKKNTKIGFDGAEPEDIIYGSKTTEETKVYVNNDGKNISIVIAKGDSVIWQEFGAGVYWNGPVGSSPNPLGPQNAFYIGTYGKGFGARQVWGFYNPPNMKDKDHLVLTHGTPASKPMYNAEQAVIKRITEIAKEVFKEDLH